MGAGGCGQGLSVERGGSGGRREDRDSAIRQKNYIGVHTDIFPGRMLCVQLCAADGTRGPDNIDSHKPD